MRLLNSFGHIVHIEITWVQAVSFGSIRILEFIEMRRQGLILICLLGVAFGLPKRPTRPKGRAASNIDKVFSCYPIPLKIVYGVLFILIFSKSKYLIVGLVSLCIAAGKITVNWGYWVNYARDIYFFWLTSVVRRYEEISTFCNFQDTRSCHFCIPVEYIQKQATKLVIT